MIRRPPRSTLFPYTTLSRSLETALANADNPGLTPRALIEITAEAYREFKLARKKAERSRLSRLRRSEEHTSELQSQSNLVCRLLLEKKKPSSNNRMRHRAFG